MTTAAPFTLPFLLDEAAFRRVAAGRLEPNPLPGYSAITSPSDYDLNPQMPAPPPQDLKGAAVLVPVIAANPLTVLLTERTDHLPSHAGQIAFPGGKIEEGESPLETALREAWEEIGLEARYVEPLGFIEPYRTGTGFLVTPAIALVRPGFTLNLNHGEVASAFEVPLAFLLDPSNHRVESRFWRGAERRFYAMPYQERYIWGATAGIIKTLHRRLFTP